MNYAVGRDGVSIVAAFTTNTWELVADLHHKILENKSQKMNDEKTWTFSKRKLNTFNILNSKLIKPCNDTA